MVRPCNSNNLETENKSWWRWTSAQSETLPQNKKTHKEKQKNKSLRKCTTPWLHNLLDTLRDYWGQASWTIHLNSEQHWSINRPWLYIKRKGVGVEHKYSLLSAFSERIIYRQLLNLPWWTVASNCWPKYTHSLSWFSGMWFSNGEGTHVVGHLLIRVNRQAC